MPSYDIRKLRINEQSGFYARENSFGDIAFNESILKFLIKAFQFFFTRFFPQPTLQIEPFSEYTRTPLFLN